jgi:DnaJ-class molecular chaperone
MQDVEKVKPNTVPFKCPNCGGRGRVHFNERVCHSCGGKGIVFVPQIVEPIDIDPNKI